MTEAEAINMPILPEEIQKFADAFVLADKLLEWGGAACKGRRRSGRGGQVALDAR